MTNEESSASHDVSTAEAELKAAQEALEAAKARLEELKKEHPAIEPGAATGQVADEAGNFASVTEVCAETSREDAPVEEPIEVTAEVLIETATVATAESPAVESAAASASFAASPESASSDAAGSTATPDWVPYSTSPVSADQSGVASAPAQTADAFAQPVAGAAAGYAAASNSHSAPVPPAASGAQGAYQQQPQPQPQPQQPYAGYTAPGYGQVPHAGPGAVPPQQPYYGYQPPYGQPPYQQPYGQPIVSTKDHVAAGLLAIFLGSLGIHKFYLGYNTAGFIMLAVTIIGSIFTFGLAAAVICIISIIEGIMYLTKSQSEFEQMYVINKREWF